MDVKITHSATKTEISVFGRQALDAERRRSPSLADKVLMDDTSDYKYSLPAWKEFFYQKLNSERNECELGKITHVLL